MKNILKATLSLLLIVLIGITPVMAADGQVEISFAVGDETLMINGQAVTVEKPYVVGEGVTLVPLRVITEAFGATVEWVNETQTINLSYPDVKIVLQINNPTAEVNGKAETLLAAPELTGGGFTMVPLRFISETFGANVSYEESTRRITVTKSVSGTGSAIVSGTVDSKYIGDSYYSWSMENPTDMYMDQRDFDGMYTLFKYDDNNSFYISIIPAYDETDFDKRFNNFKSTLTSDGFSLVKAEKNDKNSKVRTAHLQSKNKKEFRNVKMFITDKYDYILAGKFEVENPDMMNEYLRIMDTFNYSFAAGSHDLSNVVNGFRTFEDETLKLSFLVPHNYIAIHDEDSQSEFDFISTEENDSSRVSFQILSKSEVGSAEALAYADYNLNLKALNENIARFNGTVDFKDYKNFKAYQYDYTTRFSSTGTDYTRDVFFELGEYVYNIAVCVKMPNENADAFMDEIINSLTVQELDPDEVGVFMRAYEEDDGFYEAKFGKTKFKIPNAFIESAKSEDSGTYVFENRGIYLVIGKAEAEGATINAVRDMMYEVEADAKKSKENTIVSPVKTETLISQKYITLTYCTKNEDSSPTYTQYLLTAENDYLYMITVVYPEQFYSNDSREKIRSICGSISFNG
ncbi:MAG: copper amine oxidase N-terminal domain-containing protein [Clostridia bacterium]|nr:copper amine oxidase N-terminal domain-containing protein [Clostridia bacterium]